MHQAALLRQLKEPKEGLSDQRAETPLPVICPAPITCSAQYCYAWGLVFFFQSLFNSRG